jgi:hypothetical protein
MAQSTSIHTDLSWTGGDPNEGDIVTYDVYFGTTSPPLLFSGNQLLTTYDLPELEYDTTYYWQIISTDDHSESTSGPIWHFTTASYEDNEPPSQVTGLTVTDMHDGKLLISWDEASDNMGIDYYMLTRDGDFFVQVNGLSYLDTGLINDNAIIMSSCG